MSYLDWSVGRIATEVPGATAVFFQSRINFCCDGDKLLSEVLERKALDSQPIVAALAQLNHRQEPFPDLHNQSNQQVIDYILQRYHAVHRQQLPELKRLAARVESVHSSHPLCPIGLAQHLANMEQELGEHMLKEESILFPRLASDSNPVSNRAALNGPISVMLEEHEDHLAHINTIYQLTNDVTPHEQACNTWRALYRGLQAFISDLNQHIHTENNILFSRARS